MLSRDTHKWIPTLVIPNRLMEPSFFHLLGPAGLRNDRYIILVQFLTIGSNYLDQSLVVLASIIVPIVIGHHGVGVSFLLVKIFSLLNSFIDPLSIPSLIDLLLQCFRRIVMQTMDGTGRLQVYHIAVHDQFPPKLIRFNCRTINDHFFGRNFGLTGLA